MRRPPVFEQPLLETRGGPALDGDGQDEPTQQIAEVVGDDPEQPADLIGRLLLRAVNRTLRTVDILDETLGERAGRLVLHQVRGVHFEVQSA